MTAHRIPLNGGAKGYALVSDEDYPRLSRHNWTLDSTGYVIRMQRFWRHGKRCRRKLLMHRDVMGEPPGARIDHRSGDKLDNRRSNLRVATQSQNNANSRGRGGTSQFKGVYKHASQMWRACIEVNGLKRHLGVFADEESAAIAYDNAALEAWGDFAYLNFPKHKHLYGLSLTIQRMGRYLPTSLIYPLTTLARL